MNKCSTCKQIIKKQKKETLLFIDGENFKHKLGAVYHVHGKSKPEWHCYNFKGLLDKVLLGFQIDRTVFYFAKIKEHPETKEKSKQLIESQRLLKTSLERQGFMIVLAGGVRGQREGDSVNPLIVFREKGVDVRIGVDMVSSACDEEASTIILGSSDSDLQPAIKETTKRGVGCVYLGFETNPNKGLSFTCKRTILIRDSEVFEFE
ncbi:MAG: hypothetical protein A2719_05505 [Candidatus Ryanbacteria bacterium RIFCSPHIGHO2_01_FULL_45_22]|uniref:NYN domain-containing protein n=1 Tax=Candidatus Ryanbacteria bacterium RIFCSPHIGHO2_01_FULL_45_22 TaxID=1802114 RepID=A0A1G2G0Q2_9BACT|nr:MAG: hypothetical protein A2719_05505 [Candidatus Ryanbacteria bacterium RIFCSPHIGHO2_01_FULL_45_22]